MRTLRIICCAVDKSEGRRTMMWLLTCLSICGVVLNVNKDPAGFLVWMFTNACWAVIDYRKRLYAQAFLFVVYFFLALWGWISWVGNF
jgi:murein tripeptide amidase MpaA